jgi:hypothetical protein
MARENASSWLIVATSIPLIEPADSGNPEETSRLGSYVGTYVSKSSGFESSSALLSTASSTEAEGTDFFVLG